MPHWDQSWLAQVQGRLRLSVQPRQQRQGNGIRLGMGAGASLEFHDHRDYMAGDDPRHIDWRVYARSDQLVIRRYRQEISPRVEIIFDCSASMAVNPSKEHVSTTLAALLITLAIQAGCKPRLYIIDQEIHRIQVDTTGSWQEQLQQVQCHGRVDFSHCKLPDLTCGSDRIIISDGLHPCGGPAAINNIGQESGRLSFIEVLSKQEIDPQPLGAVRMVDVEGGFRDLVHDETSCATYRNNLHKHRQGWHNALSGRGPGVISCIANEGPQTALSQLIVHGLVESVQ